MQHSYSHSLPEPNFGLDSKSLEQTHFLQLHILKLAAFAWSGYLLKDKGAVMVHGLPRAEDWLLDDYEIEISYFSEENILQVYPEEFELHHFIEKYDPTQSLVLSFADEDDNLKDSYHLNLTLTLPECYVLWQEELLELET